MYRAMVIFIRRETNIRKVQWYSPERGCEIGMELSEAGARS